MSKCFVCGSEKGNTIDFNTGIALCDDHQWEMNHPEGIGSYTPNVKYNPPEDTPAWLRRLADVLEVHNNQKNEEQGVGELPIYRIDGVDWFRDKRLSEYRMVKDPFKRMSLWDGDSMVNDKMRNADESKQAIDHTHQWVDYHGLLGYESEKCRVCGIDINDLMKNWRFEITVGTGGPVFIRDVDGAMAETHYDRKVVDWIRNSKVGDTFIWAQQTFIWRFRRVN